MQGQTIGEMLRKEHHEIDRGIAGIIDGVDDRALMAESLVLLRRHIYIEEVILFPALAKAHLALTMLISMMEIEHAYMWPMIDNLAASTGPDAPFKEIRRTCVALDELLRLHNIREEDVLYRAADRMTGPNPVGHPLVDRIVGARMPADWTCELALR